jgi:hypothetical protein
MNPINIPASGRLLKQAASFPLGLMRKPCLVFAGLLAAIVASLLAQAASPTPAAVVDSRYAPIVPFIGGTWRGELPPGPNGAKMAIEMKADWTANHQGIRFDSFFVANEKRSPYTSGIYAWNPVKKQLSFFCSDNVGELIEGDVTIDRGVLVHDFTVAEAKGTTSKIRTRVTFSGRDTYTNEILRWKNEKWEKFVTVRYQRSSK